MADTFRLEIVTPAKRLFSKEVTEVQAPGAMGEFGVLAGHTQFTTILAPGVLTYKSGSEAGTLAVGKGYAEVNSERTLLLVDVAETADEIDLDAARSALAESEEAMQTLLPEDPQYMATVDNIELNMTRIRVKEGGR
ncbi:MAG: F0F1 ATP synthase subunit epsilon [Deltaproteobacteria bacterium]|nr:F0F1 ATP synthase subunit epsilon [Deltaproteobacteria bacterium]